MGSEKTDESQPPPETSAPVKKKSSRNTEKRRERSKVAARCRRGKESEIFTELSNCLPVTESSRANLDKASVMRLTLCDLKLRQMIEGVGGFKEDDIKSDPLRSVDDDSIFEAMINSALSGFVIVCTFDGDVIYVSEGIASCLGLSQYEVMGQSLFEFSHPCDSSDVKELLVCNSTNSKSSVPSDDQRSALFRIKSANSTRGRNVHHRSTNYKVVSCSGRVFSAEEVSKVAPEQSTAWFVGVCEPLLHPSDVDIPLNKQTFLSRHSPDMKFEYVDESISEFLGYNKEDLAGESLFDFYHACDGENIARSFKSLYSKGQTVTERTRFLAKGGGWIWVVTQATCINNNANKPTSVVCIHFVTSGVESEDEIVSHVQLRGANEPVIPLSKAISAAPVPTVAKKPFQDATNMQKGIAASSASCPPFRPEEITAEPIIVNPFTGPILSKPTPSTSKIFAPRTDDMDTGFLMPVNDMLIVTKGEPLDLTHLAPMAGDECVPLSNVPLLDDLLEWLDAADMEYTVLDGYEEPLPLPLISVNSSGTTETPITVPLSMPSPDMCPIVKNDVILESITNSPLPCDSPLLLSNDSGIQSSPDHMLLSPFKTPSPDPIPSASSPLCMDLMNPDAYASYYCETGSHAGVGGGATAGSSSHKSKAGGGYEDDYDTNYKRFPMMTNLQHSALSPGKCFDEIGSPTSPDRALNLTTSGSGSVRSPKNEASFDRDNPTCSLAAPSFGIPHKDTSSHVGRLKYMASSSPDPVKCGTLLKPREPEAIRPLPCKVAKSSYPDDQGSNKAWRHVPNPTPHQPPWKVGLIPVQSSPTFQEGHTHQQHAFIKRFLTNPINNSSSYTSKQQHINRLRQLHRELLTNPALVQALVQKGKLRVAPSTAAAVNSRKRNFLGKLMGNGDLLSSRVVYGLNHSSGFGGGGGLLEMQKSLVELTNQDCEVNAPLHSHPLLDGPELLTALDTEMTAGGADCL